MRLGYSQGYYYKHFGEIKALLEKEIDLSSLPLTGESQISKQTSDKYGRVVITLDLETDPDKANSDFGDINYYWEADENKLPKEYYEREIFPELESFAVIFHILNKNKTAIKLTVTDGDYKSTERPFHRRCTVEALISIFRKMHHAPEE